MIFDWIRSISLGKKLSFEFILRPKTGSTLNTGKIGINLIEKPINIHQKQASKWPVLSK